MSQEGAEKFASLMATDEGVQQELAASTENGAALGEFVVATAKQHDCDITIEEAHILYSSLHDAVHGDDAQLSEESLSSVSGGASRAQRKFFVNRDMPKLGRGLKNSLKNFNPAVRM